MKGMPQQFKQNLIKITFVKKKKKAVLMKCITLFTNTK